MFPNLPILGPRFFFGGASANGGAAFEVDAGTLFVGGTGAGAGVVVGAELIMGCEELS